MTAIYRDWKSSAAKLGGIKRANGSWVMEGVAGCWSSAADLCRAHSVEAETIPPPKTRTMAAIRRESMALARKRPNYGRAGYATRAWAYAHAMQGIEVPCVGVNYGIEKYCLWSKAPDGSNRIRAVETDAGLYEIPNWDFTPREPAEVTERSACSGQGVFA